MAKRTSLKDTRCHGYFFARKWSEIVLQHIRKHIKNPRTIYSRAKMTLYTLNLQRPLAVVYFASNAGRAYWAAGRGSRAYFISRWRYCLHFFISRWPWFFNRWPSLGSLLYRVISRCNIYLFLKSKKFYYFFPPRRHGPCFSQTIIRYFISQITIL